MVTSANVPHINEKAMRKRGQHLGRRLIALGRNTKKKLISII